MKRKNKVRLNVRIESDLYDSLQQIVHSFENEITLTAATEWALARGIEAIKSDEIAPITYPTKEEN